MGIYSEYLSQQLDFDQLTQERKSVLAEISKLRNRDVLVYVANINENRAPVSIDYTDILPISDQLSNLKGQSLDLILETPGGSGEAAEDIVKLMRSKYKDVSVIVPGWAKSAGTIIAMSANEILMDDISSLGPIDAQIMGNGKVFSAEAFLEGFEKIKKEVDQKGALNRAYIPILQAISPGEIQRAQNSLDFAKILVKDWLVKYKFSNWDVHSSSEKKVSPREKKARAGKIANKLASHSFWKTHGRSIKKEDLVEMGLRITDYSQDDKLRTLIHKYYALMQISFQSNIYKIIETPSSQIYRFVAVNVPPQNSFRKDTESIELEYNCNSCKTVSKIQARLNESVPEKDGFIQFPKNNVFKCPGCGNNHDMASFRREVEAKTKKRII